MQFAAQFSTSAPSNGRVSMRIIPPTGPRVCQPHRLAFFSVCLLVLCGFAPPLEYIKTLRQPALGSVVGQLSKHV